MSALSDLLETSLLNHLLKATTYTPVGTFSLNLHTSDPGESGLGGLVGGGAYAAVSITNNTTNFPPCATVGDPVKTNGAIFSFPVATAAWGTITHWSLSDASNLVIHAPFDEPRYVASGDTPKIAVGEMTLKFTNASSGGLTEYSKRKLLDLTFGAQAYPSPPVVYCAAGTALTGEAFTEWSDPAYTRQPTAFGAVSNGSCSNSAILTLNPSVISNVGPVSAIGLYDDGYLGNPLFLGPAGSIRSVPVGNTAKIAIGGVTVRFD